MPSTDFIGLSTRPWCASNKARPRQRAGRLDGVAFTVPADPRGTVIDIQAAA